MFLRDHDFGTNTDSERLNSLEVIGDRWRGAEFEFHDEGVQTAFARLRHSATELLELTATGLFATDNNPCILNPRTDMDRRHGLSPDTLQRIREMNSKAAEVVGNLDTFIRLARERLELP